MIRIFKRFLSINLKIGQKIRYEKEVRLFAVFDYSYIHFGIVFYIIRSLRHNTLTYTSVHAYTKIEAIITKMNKWKDEWSRTTKRNPSVFIVYIKLNQLSVVLRFSALLIFLNIFIFWFVFYVFFLRIHNFAHMHKQKKGENLI